MAVPSGCRKTLNIGEILVVTAHFKCADWPGRPAARRWVGQLALKSAEIEPPGISIFFNYFFGRIFQLLFSISNPGTVSYVDCLQQRDG